MISISDKKDCCGCTACASICGVSAISMTADQEGFLYPLVDESVCINCGTCERVCPVIIRDKQTESRNAPQKIFALHCNDEADRIRSSSGGVFSVLVNYILQRNGVVYGAIYDENFVVVHRGYNTKEESLKFRGSKYVQSDIRGIFREIKGVLQTGQLVLFSGTPCQVDGLKRYLRKPFENLITVDILCHGVPSPKVFADYVKFIKKYSIGQFQSLFMKDKTFGWEYPGVRLYYRNGRSEFNSILSNLWNKIFYDHTVNRPSCSMCRWTNLDRAGDFSIGDFWTLDKIQHDFDRDKGVSLLIVNNSVGVQCWEAIKNAFKYIECKEDECIQPVLSRPTSEAEDRELFWQDYENYGFENSVINRYQISKFSLVKNMIRQGLSYGLKELIKS